MAGLNGLDFCLQLNALDIQLPIIFLTSITDIKLAIESMKLGVEEFILKHDISGSVLPRAIVNVVESVRVRKYKQAVEKRLLLSEKQAQAIKELVVAVCHEFNNPLAAIKIGSDLVQRSSLSTEGLNLFKEFDNHFIKVQEAVNALRDLRVEKFNLNNGNTSESK